jgi:hypothetical protein
MMAKTKVTRRVKASAEDTIQSEVGSTGEPGTPLSSVTVTDIGTPASSTSAKMNDDLVDSDSETGNYKAGIF